MNQGFQEPRLHFGAALKAAGVTSAYNYRRFLSEKGPARHVDLKRQNLQPPLFDCRKIGANKRPKRIYGNGVDLSMNRTIDARCTGIADGNVVDLSASDRCWDGNKII